MCEKLVIIGAGSVVFTRGLVADLIESRWDADLVLVDIDPSALSVAERIASKMITATRAPIRLSGFTDRRQALPGATAIICTIGVGGRRAWEQDVFVPRRHGVYQPVGDTAMPGGSSRALRMIPAMVDVARDVLDLAPEAIFINYGNPMSATCRGVRKATGANVIGLCHGVNHVAGYLAKLLGASRQDFHYTAVGINHLTWFIQMSAQGRDLMPRLAQIAEERRALPIDPVRLGDIFAEADSGGGKDAPATPHEDNPFSWWLTREFGAFPAVMDRHVTEFFPQFFAGGHYYGKRLGVDAYSFERVIARGDQRYQLMREIAESDGPLPDDYLNRKAGEHEQALDIIQSIRSNQGRVYSVNLPNQGQVPNLPPDAVIECPGVADAGGIRPVHVGPMPAVLAGTLATRFVWVEMVVDAALEGDRRKFVQALVLDGSVSDPAAAEALADDLLEAQAAHLPQFAQHRKGRAAPAPALAAAK